jgi:hypothetical protein
MMKYSDGPRYPHSTIIVCAAVVALAAVPLLSKTRVLSEARVTATSVNIVNNSSREIRNVYSSHVDADDWSADLLGDDTITAGHSSSVSVGCDGQQVKVIAEDQDGCFASTVVTCGGNSSWTVTDETPRDCGY